MRPDSGIGIKPISKTGTFRIVRKAIRWALDHKLESVTLVHKGNIMKFTEGAFREWGYECAATEFADVTVSEDDLWAKFDGKLPAGKVLIKDRIADSIFQQVLLAPRRISGAVHAEPERRLPVRRLRRADRRPGHGARREHLRLLRRL